MLFNQEDEHCIAVSPIKQNMPQIVNSDPNIIQIKEFNKKSIFIKIHNFLITINELKEIIQKEYDYYEHNIILYSNGNYLDDSKKLVDYNITCKSIIHIILSNNRSNDHTIIDIY
jgi:hypothetical protein